MGTTNIAMLGIVHEELTEDNYDYWKVCLERYLVSQGSWEQKFNQQKMQMIMNIGEGRMHWLYMPFNCHAVRTYSISSGNYFCQTGMGTPGSITLDTTSGRRER